MKKMYYLEICDSDTICGGVYPLGEMTEKQVLREAEHRIKELWRSDKNRHQRIEFNICTDTEAIDMIFGVSLLRGDIMVFDYRIDEFIKDTGSDRIKRLLKKIDEDIAGMKTTLITLSDNIRD